MKKGLILLLIISAISLGCFVGNSSGADIVKELPIMEETPVDRALPDKIGSEDSNAMESNHMQVITDMDETSLNDDHPYTVEYHESKSGKICVVTFSANGHSYEMCISGLTEEFTDEQIKTMIGAFSSGKPLTITGDDLIDAEKFSEHIYGSLGDWIFSDDYRKAEDWGDHSKCWAGSASVMLWTTGWAQLAMQMNPDLPVTNVDDLFTLYDIHFINKAMMFQKDAIDFFISGGSDSYSMDEIAGNVPGYDSNDYSEFVFLEQGDSIDQGIRWIREIKNGASAGLTIMLLHTNYPLKNGYEDSTTAFYNEEKKAYVKEIGTFIDANDRKIESAFYIYNDLGDVLKVGKLDENTYITEAGRQYDAFNVLKGDIYPIGNGLYAVVDDGYIDYYSVCEPEEIDFDHGMDSLLIGNGQHAVTVSGYIADADEEQPADSIKALFITDSDNDAHDYNMPEEARGNELKSKADRPNTIQMFRTSAITVEETIQTLNLVDYLHDGYTLIATVTGLKPAP
ncbi:MAG: hypothetical protein ABTB30_07225 [Clostridia bacterium]